MKKKLITMLTGAAMAASLFTAPQVLAADQQQDRLQQKDQTCEYYVDENQDGVCDNIKEERQLQKKDGSGNPEGQALARQYRKGSGSLHFNDRESLQMTRQGACWVTAKMNRFGEGKAQNNGEPGQAGAKRIRAEETAPVKASKQKKNTAGAAAGTGDQDRVRARIHVEPATGDQDKDRTRDRVQLKDQSDPDCDGTGVPQLKQDGKGGKGARKGK